MNETEKETLKELLTNNSFMAFVRKVGNIDSLGQEIPKLNYLNKTEKSIGIMDNANVMMMATNTTFKGEVHSAYSLEYLKNILNCLPSASLGRLFIPKDKEMPCVLELANNSIVILAPRIVEPMESNEEPKKKEKTKKESE